MCAVIAPLSTAPPLDDTEKVTADPAVRPDVADDTDIVTGPLGVGVRARAAPCTSSPAATHAPATPIATTSSMTTAVGAAAGPSASPDLSAPRSPQLRSARRPDRRAAGASGAHIEADRTERLRNGPGTGCQLRMNVRLTRRSRLPRAHASTRARLRTNCASTRRNTAGANSSAHGSLLVDARNVTGAARPYTEPVTTYLPNAGASISNGRVTVRRSPGAREAIVAGGIGALTPPARPTWLTIRRPVIALGALVGQGQDDRAWRAPAKWRVPRLRPRLRGTCEVHPSRERGRVRKPSRGRNVRPAGYTGDVDRRGADDVAGRGVAPDDAGAPDGRRRDHQAELLGSGGPDRHRLGADLIAVLRSAVATVAAHRDRHRAFRPPVERHEHGLAHRDRRRVDHDHRISVSSSGPGGVWHGHQEGGNRDEDDGCGGVAMTPRPAHRGVAPPGCRRSNRSTCSGRRDVPPSGGAPGGRPPPGDAPGPRGGAVRCDER